MTNLKWTFGKVWNDSLEQREERPLKPRDVIWASEIGGAHIDRYLKMKGTLQSNPPNPRSLRKFEAGNLMEWIVKLILKRAGILIDCQNWCNHQYPGLFRVTGKLDFLAGGLPDWDKALIELNRLELPSFFNKAGDTIIRHFKENYPDGLEKIILEVKSCSSFMYDSYDKHGASPNHEFQAFHYLKSNSMREAHIVYISKDDLRLLEFGVFNPSLIEEEYKKDIETITNYVTTDTEPPKEKDIIFNEKKGEFSKNWSVGYSTYLTMLYGYKDQFEFESKIEPMVGRWNRVLSRIKEDKKMTDNNLEAISEIKKSFPNFEKEILPLIKE